ncbi:MAG TPA: hypothetical protein VFM25_09820 [Verrucomicrobiae bacterium]|nr:hypothetical protein [Verrucomicrobiae bacterium]
MEVKRGNHLAIPVLVIAEFLHVITDSKRFSPPLTMIEALDWVENFTANPAVRALEPTMSSLNQTLLWMRQFNLGRKRILDTSLPRSSTPPTSGDC